MNKKELADAVADATGVSKIDATAAVDAVLDAIAGAMVRREKISLSGFGNFEARFVKERMARNPQTGAAVPVAAHHSPKFKPAAALKTAVR